MRYSRLLIGILTIVGAVWVILSEQMSGASADAVVNAQIVTLNAVAAGEISDFDRALGASVAPGDHLAAITSELPDVTHQNDLVMQRELIAVRKGLLQARLAAITPIETELTARSEAYQKDTLRELEVRLAESQERLRLLTLDPKTADRIAISYAREEVGRVKVMLEAAQNGVFIAGGFNDAPYSEQTIKSLAREKAQIGAEITAAESEIAALSRRIDQEALHLSKMSNTTLVSPVDGILWEKLATNGTSVQRGQAVARIADCSSVVVTLSVTQSVFNRLKPGAPVVFRFEGSGEVMTGTVGRLGGTSAAGFYGSLAIAPSQRHLERADVLVNIPDLAQHRELGCAIGRTGRVFFERQPLDWLRDLLR